VLQPNDDTRYRSNATSSRRLRILPGERCRMAAIAVAKRDDIPPGTAKKVVVDGVEVLLCNVDGELYAVEDVCTHDGGPLDQGELQGCKIMCPRHGALFDVTTGRALTLPAVIPLPTYDVHVEGDDVFVEV
jgi:3-phenylpropionate/trans-cinnamate dioxygenase ferredoxin subunit